MTDSTDNARGPESLPDYDAGLLNDWGGGNVEWWQDYLRAEIGRANDYWREAVADLVPNPLGAVKVKPLVWHRADLSAWGEYADAGLLRYRMTWTYREDPEVWFTMKCEHDGKVLYQGGDEDVAIRAANEDCAARIRSALEPRDPLADPRVTALVEAARDVLRHMPDHADTAWIYFAAALAAFDKGGKADG